MVTAFFCFRSFAASGENSMPEKAPPRFLNRSSLSSRIASEAKVCSSTSLFPARLSATILQWFSHKGRLAVESVPIILFCLHWRGFRDPKRALSRLGTRFPFRQIFAKWGPRKLNFFILFLQDKLTCLRHLFLILVHMVANVLFPAFSIPQLDMVSDADKCNMVFQSGPLS